MAGVSSRQPVSGMYNIGKIKLKFRPVKKTRYYGFFLFLFGIMIILYSYLWGNLSTRSWIIIPAYRRSIDALKMIRAQFDDVKDDYVDMGIQMKVSSMTTMESSATATDANNNAYNRALHTVISTTSMKHLIYSQGYVHAKERLFQMDILGRRVATGTLSEVVGKSGLLVDKAMRMWNISGLCDLDLQRLEEEHMSVGGASETALDHLDWYTEGVNAYINSHVTPIDYVTFGLWNAKPRSYNDLIQSVSNWTNKDTLALIRYHLLYTSDYLELQDKLLMSAVEEVLDIPNGSGPFSYLFKEKSDVEPPSMGCALSSTLCIPTIGSTSYLASLPGDVLYSSDLHEKAVTPSKYMNMELKYVSADNTVSVQAKGVTVPGIPFIWNNGENDALMWSLHSLDPFYSADHASSDGDASTMKETASVRTEFIAVKDKKNEGVSFDIVDSSNPEEDSLISWIIATNSIISANEVKKALGKSERMGLELYKKKQAILRRNQAMNVHNTVESLFKLNFGDSIDVCESAYDSAFTHANGNSIATLFCMSKQSNISPVVFHGNDIVSLQSDGISLSTPSKQGKNIVSKAVVVGTDFGFNQQAGLFLAKKLSDLVKDSTCANDSESTCSSIAPLENRESLHTPMGNMFTQGELLHSASGASLSKLASTYMNGACSLAYKSSGTSFRVVQNSKLSLTQAAVIRDLLSSNTQAHLASYGVDDTAPFFLEHFRLQLYTQLMRRLFNTATLSERINENRPLEYRIKYFSDMLLVDMPITLYEHGTYAQMGIFVGKCKAIVTAYLLKLKTWIRNNIITVEDDPKVVSKGDVVPTDVYRNMLNYGYLEAMHSERLSYYSDWYVNFLRIEEASHGMSWYSHVTSTEFGLQGSKEIMICQALKNTMDIIEHRASKVSDSNIDDHENRAQQYGNAVLALEGNKLSADDNTVNEFRKLFKWGTFHTALFSSIYQESYVFRDVFTKRLHSPSVAGTVDSLLRTGYAPFGFMHETSTAALKIGYNTRFEEMNVYKRGAKTDPHMYFSLYGSEHSGSMHNVAFDKMNVSMVYNNRYVFCDKEI